MTMTIQPSRADMISVSFSQCLIKWNWLPSLISYFLKVLFIWDWVISLDNQTHYLIKESHIFWDTLYILRIKFSLASNFWEVNISLRSIISCQNKSFLVNIGQIKFGRKKFIVNILWVQKIWKSKHNLG